ncbi:DNA alkylation repair protein [Polymorphospora rubra]|uniref:DNA alkylation repair protein n=1 Tax=Polymorphospora rubra TaxID=338584 RepID=UPI0033FAC44D
MVDVAPPLAAAVLDRLTTVFGAAADPARGTGMAAYMRDRFPFLGIPAPARTALGRQVLAGLGRPTEEDLRAVAVGCWALPEREYQYFACDWLRRHARICSADFLSTARALVTTRSWWDTVDPLAVHLVGRLVATHPELVPAMDDWIGDDDPWLVRTAILHQLSYREATDAGRLFRYCVRQAGHPDFFVRKAIGWALREHARTDPEAVRAFVAAHRARLAPLSVREALRNIT